MALFGLIPDPPKPPDPAKVAAAQTASNLATATAQQKMAMTGQTTPFGSLSYVVDPSQPSGYRAVTSLSPDQQELMDAGNAAQLRLLPQWADLQSANMDVGQDYAGVITGALNRADTTMNTPFSFDAGRARVLTDINQQLMDPMWATRQSSLESDMLNRGLRPGSAEWQNNLANFEDARTRAYNDMFLNGYTTANNAALTERNLPLTDLGSLYGLPGVSAPNGATQPQFMSTPSPGVAPTDVTTPTMQNYAIQQQGYNANLGGIYGLGGTALGGWAMNGFKLPSFG